MSDKAFEGSVRSRQALQTDDGADTAVDIAKWLKLLSIAIVGLFVIALIFLLREARFIALPLTVGVVVSLLLGPLADRGERHGIPSSASIVLFIIALLISISMIFFVLTPKVSEVTASVPRAIARVTDLAQSVTSMLHIPLASKPSAPGSSNDTALGGFPIGEISGQLLAVASPALSELAIFLCTVILFVSGRKDIRMGIARIVPERDHRLAVLRSFNAAERTLADYFTAISLINLALGLAVAIAFFLVGVPAPLAWGVAAVLANFLPIIGPLSIKALLLGFGIVSYPTLGEGLVPLGVFLAINFVEANFITPKIVGARISMNPLLIFASVLFWMWMWGLAGAFIAMPLLAITSVLQAEFKSSQTLPLPG